LRAILFFVCSFFVTAQDSFWEIAKRRSAGLSVHVQQLYTDLIDPWRRRIVAVARGWESKSVAEQQAERLANSSEPNPRLAPEQLERQRKQQAIRLSRQRVLQQLQAAHHPRHREMLQAALAELDAQLSRLG